MVGTSLSLGFAALFGVNQIIMRRGVLRASVNYVANISIFSGPLFFALIALITGELPKMGQFTWQTYIYFALAGVIHFAFGRTFAYRSVQLIGATRSNSVTGLNAIVSVALAIAVLHERLTPLVVLGMMLSMSGPLIIGMKESTRSGTRTRASSNGKDVDSGTLWRGILFGLGASLFWGSSSVLIKLGLDNGGLPIAGSMVCYLAASTAVSYKLLDRQTRREILTPNRPALQLALMTGMTTNLAQLMRFIALDHAPVITVSLVSRTVPVWVLILAFLLNRHLESFSRWVLLGNGLLVAGTVLVII